MHIFLVFGLELIGVYFFTWYLFRRYAVKSTPTHVEVVVRLTWFLVFFAVCLLPLDIHVVSNFLYIFQTVCENIPEDSREFYHEIIYILWHISYWSIVFISLIILPIMIEYELCADFKHEDRLNRAINRNVYFYSIIGIISILFIFYLIVIESFTM